MHDVVILGGGLAALTLSLQLKQRLPQLDIVVLERRRHPVPHAAHKVGESSVEIQAHYLSHVLGLKDYLERAQLKKFGFRFFFSDGAQDLTQVTELGASTFLPTQSYQLDRGVLENDLALLARERGIAYRDATRVVGFELGERGKAHRVTIEHGDGDGPRTRDELECRWLIDASGRAGLVKRKLDLAQPNAHDVNAVWFRIGAKVDVNDWADRATPDGAAWLARCDPPNRWLSTNHLVGDGYWVWLIPLASGSHSVGIVADEALHPLDTLNSFDKAMAWLRVHQPRLHRDLEGKRDQLQDFAFFKHFSYGCKRVFNGSDRWALTGEAGLFLDPFYSPGGDFISISNTFVTELIAQDQPGPGPRLAGLYERIYFLLYESWLPLYLNQYPLFGDPEVMPLKVLWDYTFYWGAMCPLFFQKRLTDVAAMTRLQKSLADAQAVNVAMQRFFRAWS
ncbi:MAG TPA: FAD-dependent monooxygenase, partial [Burkholderiaceae bacterium]|nr:FAD-dependent monooxygenase [Burkholderiaceae bacterium]